MFKNRSSIKFMYKTMTTFSQGTILKDILVDRIGRITTIGINRPDKRNCINKTIALSLEEAILNFENDTESYVAVFYGIGGNFCAGYDLQELSNGDESNQCATNFSIFPTRKFIKKPTIAALSGYTVAGGLELALLCDLRVMEETALVGLYGRRFGVPLVDGGTVRLPAVVGLSRALDLILTGRSLNAKEAFEWGLVNRIVACGTGLGQAIQLATCLEKYSQECLISDRNSTYNAAFSQVYDELIEYEKNKANKLNFKHIIEGAKKFLNGIGKHGKSYNIKEKTAMEWENEYSNASKSKL